MNAVEWVYEVVIPLPFGWKVIGLKEKFRKPLGNQYRRYAFYKKQEIKPGTYRERYWPDMDK